MTPSELDELMTALAAFNYQYVDTGTDMNSAVMKVISAIEQQHAWECEANEEALRRQRKQDALEDAALQAEEEAIARMRGEM